LPVVCTLGKYQREAETIRRSHKFGAAAARVQGMKVETGVLSSWWKIQRNDHLVGFDWDSHEVAEVGEARLGSGF
jgi:hypothetical protein